MKKNQNKFIFNVNETGISVVKKDIKNINLRISREGSVTLSAPLRCSIETITAFITEKTPWIEQHLVRIKSRLQTVLPVVDTIERCAYLGKNYPVILHETLQKPQVILETNEIRCLIKPDMNQTDIQKMLQNWQKNQMSTLLPELIHKWQSIVGVQVLEWGVKSMKTRWGSCNIIKKRIWLNLILIQKPLICLEYVLVHELVHLLEPSHNQRFHRLMTQFMPDWKQYKRMLMV